MKICKKKKRGHYIKTKVMGMVDNPIPECNV